MPNRKGVKATVNTAYTSPARIKLQQRRAQALALRVNGRSFKDIAEELSCATGTAFNYITKAIKDLIPQETAKQVLALQLQRYDALVEVYQPKALAGDAEAAKLVLKIENQRSRLFGLYPGDGKTSQHLHVHDAGPAKGLEVVFRRSPFVNEPIPSPLDLGHDEYRALPPPPEIPIARPEPQPTYEPEPTATPEPPRAAPKTEFDLGPDELDKLGLLGTVPWHKRPRRARPYRGQLQWGRDKKSR